MTLTTDRSKPKLTLAQFVEQLPDREGRYELVNGEIMRILATRQHEDIADFITRQFDKEVERLSLNYRVSGRIVIGTKTKDGIEQGRNPDVSVVDKLVWESNRSAYSALFEPLEIAVEVVSTNWEDDYVDKLDEYQRFGIREYWIVDYLAIASRSYLGNPKIPAVFVYLLDENGVYRSQIYRGDNRIISATFPELNLTVEQILNA
ncbi:MAG: Uma2 family endonuclease [Cyanosarcina radialis HA8281-LM2]|jgi:Uma2 family endonuclease|nr:Uma2 family endonuclease [Cyanosarcina radialis HA8281-LM2]